MNSIPLTPELEELMREDDTQYIEVANLSLHRRVLLAELDRLRELIASWSRECEGLRSSSNQRIADMVAQLLDKDLAIADLSASMLRHFQEEHLMGDGPEIDRWKRRLAEREEQIEAYQFTLADYEKLTLKLGEATSRYEQAEKEVQDLQDREKLHEPGTPVAIMHAMFDEAERLGHPRYSAQHALSFFVRTIESLRNQLQALSLERDGLREQVQKAQELFARVADCGLAKVLADVARLDGGKS